MMQSFYADIRIAGGDLTLGYAGQALLAAVAVALLGKICWQRRGAGPEMAALCVTALLVTPFLYDYDLMIAVPALAWLTAEAVRTGLLRGEAALLLILYFTPFVASGFGRFLGVPLAPPLLLALLLAISRRAEQQPGVRRAALAPSC
jgi:Sec-independent protein secretion pathway component TatC